MSLLVRKEIACSDMYWSVKYCYHVFSVPYLVHLPLQPVFA